MISEPENSALARSQGPEEPVLDSCKFQGFVAKFSRYLPLSAKEEGRFPGRPTVLTDRQKEYVREELAKGVSQRELARLLEVSRWKIQQVAEGASGLVV